MLTQANLHLTLNRLRRYGDYHQICQKKKRKKNVYDFPIRRIMEPEEDREQFLTHWGFTIYRIHYGPGYDEQWSRLLQNINDRVAKGLDELDEADENPDATAKAQN
ncbi:MAG: hypothetical protein EOO38_29440 [Cytophagaceae bacterium]|nr:MAG: hypothetical protein EOO38_29440 [Cytophagaceae bacterium]